MDFQRENNTPIDRVDEDMIRRMLNENYGDEMPYYKNSDQDYPYYRMEDNSISDKRHCQHSEMHHEHVKEENYCAAAAMGHKGFEVPMLSGVPLAMVYSPLQEWRNLYEAEIGFEHGTIFKDLDFPWYPTPCSSCGCRNR